MKTPQQAADKWAARVSQSGAYYTQGVNTTSKDWATNALQAASRRDAGLRQAMTDGRIDKGIQRNAGKWKQKAGSAAAQQAWAQNTPLAKPAYLQAMGPVFQSFATAESDVASMPRDTVQQRIARGAAYLQSVSDQAQQRKVQ
jgi:hypothetical protein